MESIFLALERQRDKLGLKLTGETPCISVKLIQDSVRSCVGEVSSKKNTDIAILSGIARLLDNLLDDEGVDLMTLVSEIREPKYIEEWGNFLNGLTPDLRKILIIKGVRAIKTMSKYNSTHQIKYRLLEARLLAQLYTLLILNGGNDTKDLESYLMNLFIASYMFCDIKDIYSDKNFRNLPRQTQLLCAHATSFYINSRNRNSLIGLALNTGYKSISLKFQK